VLSGGKNVLLQILILPPTIHFDILFSFHGLGIERH
jgi:hypothetical protein